MSNLLEWDNVNPALPSISCIWASGSSKARANASTVGWMAYRIYPNGFLRRAFCQYLLSCSTVHPSYRFPQSFEAAFLKSSHPSAPAPLPETDCCRIYRLLRAAAGQMQLQSRIPLAMLRNTDSVLPSCRYVLPHTCHLCTLRCHQTAFR